MPSKKEEDGGESLISPVLFMTVDGEPMRFFLRPGPAKVQLLPRIKAGGGMVCKAQQPGAILLADPEEVGSFPESTAHWYVSTKYIQDCIEKNLQLDVEDYRISPESVQRRSTRQNISKQSFTGSPGGRIAYSPEEDAAILRYVSKHKTEVGGNRLWQEMAKKNVTNHSWQSMKCRYKMQLARRQLEVEEEEKTEGEAKVEENQETHVEKPSCDEEEDDLPPQISSSADTAVTDLTQTDAQPIPAESTQPEPVEAQTSSSPQQEAPCLHPQTDAQPIPDETTQPEPEEPPTTSSSDPEVMPEDSPPAQPEPLPDTPPSQKKQKKKQMASPTPVQPQRRSTRRQLEPEEPPPSPPGIKLRSSSLRTPQKAASSPQPPKKMRPTDEPVVQNAASVDQRTPKRARRDSGATVAENEEKGQATPSKKEQAGEEANTINQKEAAKGGKKKEKRKLGILEMATKEFEDPSESDQDENTDLQKPAEMEAIEARPTETPLPTSATAAPHPGPGLESSPGPGPGPSLQESNHRPEAACPLPAADQQIPSTSKAHLFIFENESQEEESQSVIDKNTAAPSVSQLVTNKDAAISLTQVQLEEDKQRIRGLMKQTNQDLASVTKALLKASGDFSAALRLLLTPSSIPGLFWNRHDDGLLLSADPVVRQQLQEKYGEEDVARRLVFLEVE